MEGMGAASSAFSLRAPFILADISPAEPGNPGQSSVFSPSPPDYSGHSRGRFAKGIAYYPSHSAQERRLFRLHLFHTHYHHFEVASRRGIRDPLTCMFPHLLQRRGVDAWIGSPHLRMFGVVDQEHRDWAFSIAPHHATPLVNAAIATMLATSHQNLRHINLMRSST